VPNASRVLSQGQEVRLRCPRCGNHLVQRRCPVCAPEALPAEAAKAKASPAVSRPERAVEAKSAKSDEKRAWHWMALGIEALVIAAVVMRLVTGRGQEPPPPAPVAVEVPQQAAAAAPTAPAAKTPDSKPGVEYRNEASGQLSEIAAPDARQALIAFCKHPSNRGKLTPLAIGPTVPRSAGERLGLIRDADDVAAVKAVRIRRDIRTNRWIIGVPWRPVELEKAPILPPGSETVPI
jgi:hypothetical protein